MVAEVEKMKVEDDMEMVSSSSDRMEIDVPNPMDTEHSPSLVEAFEQILQLIHCDKVVDEIQKIERSMCYGCQNDCPGQKDHNVCFADWEGRVDKCFDTAYENVALEPLFQRAKKEIKEKHPHVNITVLNILADTVEKNSQITKRDIKKLALVSS